MEFFSTIDWINSFTVLESLAVTATVNHVTPFLYLSWVMVNMKIRLELYRLSTIKNKGKTTSKQICLLPHPEIVFKENGYKKKHVCSTLIITYRAI